jgi:drug/metabolite transporter (DMT)-like permease
MWTICVVSGVLGFLGQVFLTKGFQLESVGIASVMRYLDIVFVFLWDTLLLREKINGWSFVGAAIIFSCAIAIAIRRATAN